MTALRAQSGAAAARTLIVVALVAVLVLIAYLALAISSGPMDFAGRGTAAATGNSGADPTGGRLQPAALLPRIFCSRS